MVVAVATLSFASLGGEQPAEAVTGSQFQAGNIISDSVFYNATTMSTAQIQTFLNQQVPNCAAGYTCLKNYRETSRTIGAKVEGCRQYNAVANQTAASIIADVSFACGINPQVLIVLLQKEQALVTDSAPSSRQYRSATGYGCPDTADCDTQYYGFFNQLYNAAWQFKKYRYNPGGRQYQAGRVNTIQWHPNAACGSSQVYIENQATAGLYLYTPYRPNAAALANLYGTGDACSAYGNRNFWRLFNDWFGNTIQRTDLVRTAASTRVYLVVGSVKYPILDGDTYKSLSAIAPLAYVSQSFVDGLTTGRNMTRLISDPSGNLFLIDPVGRFHFTTCTQVADFGYKCPDSIQLLAGQVSRLANRGDLTNTVSTPDGLYRISGGARTQAVDAIAMKNAGYTERTSALAATSTIAPLRLGTPIMRDDVYIQRGTGAQYGLWSGKLLAPVSDAMHRSTALAAKLGLGRLEAGSFDLLQKGAALSPVVSTTTGTLYALTPGGKSPFTSSAGLPAATKLPAAILDKLPATARIGNPALLRSPLTAPVYVVQDGAKRHVPSPTDLAAAQATPGLGAVVPVADPLVGAFASGPAWIAPASLVKSTASDKVWFVDGTKRMHVASPAMLASLTTAPVRVLDEAAISSLTEGPSMQAFLSCPSGELLSIGGRRYTVSAAAKRTWAIDEAARALSGPTCTALGAAAGRLTEFVREPGGAVYRAADGARRHIVAPGLLTSLAGSTPVTPGDAELLSRVEVATPIVSTDLAVRPELLQAKGTSPVYLVDGSELRHIPTPADLAAARLTTGDDQVYVVPAATIAAFGRGADVFRSGAMVRASGRPEVFVVDAGTKHHLTSFDISTALGAPAVQTTTTATTEALGDAPALTDRLRCGTVPSIGLGGRIYPIPAALSAHYPGPFVQVDAATCTAFAQPAKPLSRFLRAPDRKVYLIENGTKRQVMSIATLANLGGTDLVIDVSAYSVSRFPTGTAIP